LTTQPAELPEAEFSEGGGTMQAIRFRCGQFSDPIKEVLRSRVDPCAGAFDIFAGRPKVKKQILGCDGFAAAALGEGNQ
jgi:hypothetical protein